MAGAAAFLVVDVAGTGCAVRREAVREVLPLPRLWRPPGVPAALAGFFSLGGAAVPVLDLAVLFGLAGASAGRPMLYRHLLLVGEAAPLALLVDRVDDLVSVEPEAVTPLPQGTALNGCVAGELRCGGRLLHELAVSRILLAEERARLDAQTRLAQERLAEWAA
ncbi:CheW protein [Methylobacterium sp. 4-46]|uniref:chemotaxis protein CheW n=1 Tax=unclassified Methylobacterium TaxID=2615210 RepID=UPI000152CEFC|nr:MULTISPECIES: chemotaxis protein CheW [Methylobacterium]ACA14812.1 CheW protein [Methylobacterium sp. 4-46]WFT80557.1 chemotaxis protein CheW [Methylobacterium nodulans]